MAVLNSSLAREVAIRLLFSPLGSNILARSACVVGGLVFPVYSSFKAIELNDKLEQEHWLLYWTAYGCFNAVENLSDKLLYWLPGYYHVKLVFLIWLQLPLSNGARNIVMNYLRPLLLKYQAVLDSIVNGTRSDLNSFLVAHLKELKLIKMVMRKLTHYVFTAARDIWRSLNNPGEGMTGSGTTASLGSILSLPGDPGNASDA